jgi:hypothetical protein
MSISPPILRDISPEEVDISPALIHQPQGLSWLSSIAYKWQHAYEA